MDKLLFAVLAISLASQAWSASSDEKIIARGKYLVTIGGCNDCHTEGFLPKEGNVPVSEWLKGSTFGWSGPWGTTYPPNLRLFVKDLSADEWVTTAKTLKRRPPMPWFDLNAMKDDDLRAVYHFIKSLGDPGKQAPEFIPTGMEAPMPRAVFPGPPPSKN
jgi:mono/diheme cytochrome c family protein